MHINFFGKRITLTTNKQESEKEFRKRYNKCRHCKYAVLKGRDYKDVEQWYCLHPNIRAINMTIDDINPEGYCAKYEMPESLSIELMNRRLDNTSSRECVDSLLRSSKKLRQDNSHK